MNKIPSEIIRKNNISAYLFLATAILSVLLVIFMAYVFVLIFASITGIFSGLGGNAENGFNAADIWQLYAFFFLCVFVIISQFASFGLIKARKHSGRIVGIISFILTVIAFTPLSLLLIYPFAFLVLNNGKYIYQNLSKN